MINRSTHGLMLKTPRITCYDCIHLEESVFCDLGGEHLARLDAAKTLNCYQPRQVIFYEGNEPFGIHCVCSGQVKIYKSDPQGRQHIIRLLGSGDAMGHRSLLAGTVYSASAETLTDATVCFIDKKTFLHILETHPTTAMHVMCMLARDLEKQQEHSVGLVHKNVRERLAELLLAFQVRFGRKTKKGIELEILLTREELAELIGTTQESVIRLLSEFRQEGVVETNGRLITLLHPQKLADSAGTVVS